jgi:hypothetical protein
MQATINTTIVYPVKADKYKSYAIHRILIFDSDKQTFKHGKQWTVTHLETGYNVGLHFPTRKIARQFVTELQAINLTFEWSTILNQFTGSLTPEIQTLLNKYKQSN